MRRKSIEARVMDLNIALLMLLALAVLAVLAIGCAGSPVQASTTASYVPLHNNIPATFAGHPEGPIIYLCATQPRTYSLNGRTTAEEDHYLQYTPCPAIPID